MSGTFFRAMFTTGEAREGDEDNEFLRLEELAHFITRQKREKKEERREKEAKEKLAVEGMPAASKALATFDEDGTGFLLKGEFGLMLSDLDMDGEGGADHLDEMWHYLFC